MLVKRALLAAAALVTSFNGAQAIELDVTDRNSIQRAADTAFQIAFSFYVAPGELGDPYYWWHAGAFMGILVQRWSIFQNDTWNELITEGIQAQVGENKDFEPEKEVLELGNDDQSFWAFTVLDAAEEGFPDPPDDQPSWLGLAQAVFNRQMLQWDETNCDGGMRWQKFFQNRGYDYKNAPTNGAFFQIAARLARFTGNETYAKYADRMFDWIENSNFWVIEEDGLHLYDGVHIVDCGTNKHNPDQYSYNVAFVISGAAYMYDITPEGPRKEFWREKIDTLLVNSLRWFYNSAGPNTANRGPTPNNKTGIMMEAACEPWEPQTCNDDQPVFKGFTTRWLAITSKFAPWTNETIWPLLVASAEGAARQCVGTADRQIPGTTCGRRWWQSRWDGFSDFGSQLSAASVFQTMLIHERPLPLTLARGGTSRSDPEAGSDDSNPQRHAPSPALTKTINAGDKFGAAILTILFAGGFGGMVAWMLLM